MKTLCIYHGNCADGFGAAWVVRKALGKDNVEFHPGIYQTTPPDITGRDIIIVDFSYKRSVMMEIAKNAKSILIIDHHKSAIEDLNGITQEPDICPIDCCFDIDHSGAMLAWMNFFPNIDPPKMISHIEDRDLWRFKIEGTREIQAAVFSYPYDFEVWDELINSFDMAGSSNLLREGAAIERKHFKDINELISSSAFRMEICGYDVPVLNAPYFYSSDAGHIMGDGEPFAACYWDNNDGRVFSLRSAEEGIDVSEIAKQFGGGGHKHAAGFSVNKNHELAIRK